jgi:single-stranded-DNA-specific exonuclease
LVSSANNYPNPHLSGAGVVWKFCKYCDEMYLTDYADSLVDLATCGIIADMVDMTSKENRYICSLGFKNIKNTGIKKVNGGYKFDSQAISFGIAPLVNAANRLNINEQALKLFLEDGEKEVNKIIKTLKSAKEQQNVIVSELMPSITVQAQMQINNKVMSFVIDTDSSVSGLIGNQLVAKYQRPVFVLKKTDNGYSGSGRGYGLDNFKQYVDNTGLACTGGHENAFGIEISGENYNTLMYNINQVLSDVEFSETQFADIELNLEQVDTNLIDNFKAVNLISGEGFKPLKVVIRNITDYDVGTMSNGKHLKISVGDLIIIKWNYQGDFEEFDGRPFSIIGGLSSGFFGRTFYKQIIIDDYMFEDVKING